MNREQAKHSLREDRQRVSELGAELKARIDEFAQFCDATREETRTRLANIRSAGLMAEEGENFAEFAGRAYIDNGSIIAAVAAALEKIVVERALAQRRERERTARGGTS